MPPLERIPLPNLSMNFPAKRHHSTNYYARRVTESLTKRVVKLICACFLGFLLFIGVVLFVLWLSLRPHRPRFHVHDFAISGVNQETGFQNAMIVFNVTIRNPNQNIGIFYDAMNGAIYYLDRQLGITPLLFPFYQPPKNTTSVVGELNDGSLTIGKNDLGRFFRDWNTGTVMFRLQLTSTIRFRLATWDTQRHRMHTSCDVTIGTTGLVLESSKAKRCSLYFD